MGPPPRTVLSPSPEASEEQTEAQGWLVRHSVGFGLMRLPAFQSPTCVSLEASLHLFGRVSWWQSGVYQHRGPWICSQAVWSSGSLLRQERPSLAGAEDTACLLDAFMMDTWEPFLLEWGEGREWKVRAILLAHPQGVAIPQGPPFTLSVPGRRLGHHLGKQVILKVQCDSARGLTRTQGEEPQLPQDRP